MAQKLNIRSDAAYGFSGPVLDNLAPVPVVSNRNPTARDKGKPGTVWINQTLGTIYVVVKTAANQTTWASYSTQTGSFHSVDIDTGDLEVVQGDITVDKGDVIVTTGSVLAGGALSVGAQITAQTTIACGDTLTCGGAIITDDPEAGSSGNLTITNTIVDAQTGVGQAKAFAKGSSPVNAAGWLQLYNGTDTILIPFWNAADIIGS